VSILALNAGRTTQNAFNLNVFKIVQDD